MNGDFDGHVLNNLIIWLAPRAGKVSQILRCDWLPERARWSYLARSGLPVARPLGIESLIPSNNAIVSSVFSLFWGKTLTEMFGKLSTFTERKGKRMESSWCSENFVSAAMNVS